MRNAWAWVLGTVLLAACGGTRVPDNAGRLSALGGSAVTLPEGVTLAASLHAASAGETCIGSDGTFGAGGFVTVCLRLNNATAHNVNVTLPGELIFKADLVPAAPYANGLVGQPVVVPAQPGPHTYTLRLFGADLHFQMSDAYAVYAPGPVLGDPQVQTLAGILAGK
ncbi:MAG TPA: hypothetical protein VHN99_01215, partial [Deinococcales bacterium]|nr:hypothetical protein [Deinococcales bacterium]